VYLEGFRILPYGDDDWLSLDADYAVRPRQLEMLRDLSLAEELKDADPDEGLVRLTATASSRPAKWSRSTSTATWRATARKEEFWRRRCYDVVVDGDGLPPKRED